MIDVLVSQVDNKLRDVGAIDVGLSDRRSIRASIDVDLPQPAYANVTSTARRKFDLDEFKRDLYSSLNWSRVNDLDKRVAKELTEMYNEVSEQMIDEHQ